MTGTVERACTVTPRHRHKGKANEKNGPGTPTFPRAEEPSKSPSHLPSSLPSLAAPPCLPSRRVSVPSFPHPSASVLRRGVKAGQSEIIQEKLKNNFSKVFSNPPSCEVLFKQDISQSIFLRLFILGHA